MLSIKVYDFDTLRQVILVDKFKNVCVWTEIRLHLDQQKVSDLKSAVMLAGDCALMHKKNGFSHKPYPVKIIHQSTMVVNPKAKPGYDDLGSSQKIVNDKYETQFPSSETVHCVIIDTSLGTSCHTLSR